MSKIRTYITSEQIRQRVCELGAEIRKDYEGKELMVIGILKGSVIFLSDLARCIDMDVSFDFVAISSYGAGTKSTGVVKILKDLSTDIRGKHVLIVEDIIDTGLTLEYLRGYLELRNPASVRYCTLLDKPSRRKAAIQSDYVGFTIQDEFVIGYGLDFDEHYRNLPYIGVLETE